MHTISVTELVIANCVSNKLLESSSTSYDPFQTNGILQFEGLVKREREK